MNFRAIFVSIAISIAVLLVAEFISYAVATFIVCAIVLHARPTLMKSPINRLVFWYFLNPISTGGFKSSRTTINPSAVSEGLGLGSPNLLTLFLSVPDRSQRNYF